jgi:predicted RNA-binding protein with PUA-like domain
MNYFLAKSDPQTYGINDLATEKRTTWNGVRNPQAVQVLKSMKRGDKILIYHSQGEAAIVGLASVVGDSRPDPKDAKSWLVDFKFVKKFKQPYITLTDIKESKKFNDFALVKQGRLSTMAVPSSFISWLKQKGLIL